MKNILNSFKKLAITLLMSTVLLTNTIPNTGDFQNTSQVSTYAFEGPDLGNTPGH